MSDGGAFPRGKSDYIYKSYMGYRPGGVTGRVAGAKWQGQNEFHVEEPTKAII